MSDVVRIATRQSQLALWQSRLVASLICQTHRDLIAELVPMTTEGDRRLDASLAKLGGKGLFIKELEVAMLEDRADIAVHSMKDVPAHMPDGFVIAAVLPREDPRDALISHRGHGFTELPEGARVGTSSLRRQTQLLNRRPDLNIAPLRGNVDTRLGKVEAGDYDAIVLAAAGLRRLGWDDRITEYLPTSWCLPAAAQGAIGIECRADNGALRERLAALEDRQTRVAVDIERDFCEALGASCTSPVAALAEIDNDTITARARVLSEDGSTLLEASCDMPLAERTAVGAALARDLIGRGALELLGEQ
jgi:hydroxymethylbilane synthase